jgi:hypothetical protein
MLQSYRAGSREQDRAATQTFNNFYGAAYGAGGPGVRHDMQEMIARANAPEEGGSKTWRAAYMGKLQDKINANTPEAAEIRTSLGLKDGEKFDWKTYGQSQQLDMTHPPVPGYGTGNRENGQELGSRAAAQMPGQRPEDQPGQTRPTYSAVDGRYVSNGRMTNADGSTIGFHQQDTLDPKTHSPVSSVRTYDGAGANIKVGDTPVTGITSETTTWGPNGTRSVVAQTKDGPVNYTIDRNGNRTLDASGVGARPVLSPVAEAGSSAMVPTGTYSHNRNDERVDAAGDFDRAGAHNNVYSGQLGGSWNPASGNFWKINTTTTDTVDAQGHLSGRNIQYSYNSQITGKTNSVDLGNVQVGDRKVNLNDVNHTTMTWDAQRGGYKVEVFGASGAKPLHTLYTNREGTQYVSGD